MTPFGTHTRNLATSETAATPHRVIAIQEISGTQEVTEQLAKTMGSETQRRPPQSGNWSHGWYTIDTTDRLYLEVDPIWLGPIAKNQLQQGEITLHNAAGEKQTHTVNILGQNSPSILVSRSASIYENQDSIRFTPMVRDMDGPLEAKLKPGQIGRWQYGTFGVSQEGELTVFLDHNSLPALAKGTSLTGQLALHTVDGTQHRMTMQVDGVNDQPTIQGVIELVEGEGPKKIHLTVRDPDGGTESALLPNQSHKFMYGTYQTDKQGELTLTLDRLINLPQDQWCNDTISLLTIDGSLVSQPLRVRGLNAPSQLEPREYFIFKDQQSICVKPQVQDEDGPTESQLKTGQVGTWERGTFVVNHDGSLTVFAERNLKPSDEARTQDYALQLESVDGTQHYILLKDVGSDQLPLITAQTTLEHENNPAQQATESARVVSDTYSSLSWHEQLARYLPTDSALAYSLGF